MAIIAGICDSYTNEIVTGVHTDTDTYKIALYTDTADLSEATTTYTTAGEVVGTGYTAGGQDLVGFQSLIVNGTTIIDFTTDPEWANATFETAGALIYNSSKLNTAVCVLDFGQTITTTNGTFLIEFPPATETDALIRFV